MKTLLFLLYSISLSYAVGPCELLEQDTRVLSGYSEKKNYYSLKQSITFCIDENSGPEEMKLVLLRILDKKFKTVRTFLIEGDYQKLMSLNEKKHLIPDEVAVLANKKTQSSKMAAQYLAKHGFSAPINSPLRGVCQLKELETVNAGSKKKRNKTRVTTYISTGKRNYFLETFKHYRTGARKTQNHFFKTKQNSILHLVRVHHFTQQWAPGSPGSYQDYELEKFFASVGPELHKQCLMTPAS